MPLDSGQAFVASGEFGQRLADLPVVAEGVDEAADAPIVVVGHLPDDGGPGSDGPVEGGVGIVDGEDDADGAAVEALWAVVLVLGRFVGEPELGSVDCQFGDDGAAAVVVTELLGRSEGGSVELDCLDAVADGEEGSDGRSSDVL